MTTISRRGMVRLVSYTAALVVALSVAAAGGYAAANRYRTTIEYGYQPRSASLANISANLDITLQKGPLRHDGKPAPGPGLQIMEGGRQRQSCLEQLPSTAESSEVSISFCLRWAISACR